jgi:hypothetical protein
MLAGLAGAALFVAGCATAESPDPWQGLTVNLTADQVRARLGEAASVRPMKSSQGPAEIWTYRRMVSAGTVLIAARTQDMPVMNPLTGQQSMMPAPVYDQEARTVEQELQLLIFDGKLVSWKRTERTRRDYQ